MHRAIDAAIEALGRQDDMVAYFVKSILKNSEELHTCEDVNYQIYAHAVADSVEALAALIEGRKQIQQACATMQGDRACTVRSRLAES